MIDLCGEATSRAHDAAGLAAGMVARALSAERPIDELWASADFRASDETLLDDMAKTFGFQCSEFGMRLARRSAHFRGHSLFYENSRYHLTSGFSPETTLADGILYLAADLRPGVHPRAIDLVHLLELRAPERSWRVAAQKPPYSLAELRAAFEKWAAGLRELAPDILAGDPAPAIPWGYAW